MTLGQRALLWPNYSPDGLNRQDFQQLITGCPCATHGQDPSKKDEQTHPQFLLNRISEIDCFCPENDCLYLCGIPATFDLVQKKTLCLSGNSLTFCDLIHTNRVSIYQKA